jgi:hypothetical protein
MGNSRGLRCTRWFVNRFDDGAPVNPGRQFLRHLWDVLHLVRSSSELTHQLALDGSESSYNSGGRVLESDPCRLLLLARYTTPARTMA